MPSYLGGEYEVFALKYKEFIYPEFYSLQTMTVDELKEFIDEFETVIEKNTLVGDFGMFHLLNIAYFSV